MIIIGVNVQSIGSKAFPSTIQEVYITSLVAPTIKEDSFKMCDDTIVIYVIEDATGYDNPSWQNINIIYISE